ncbi:MAG: hypothetical protein KIT58_12225 [Planctomycetota bacterium]|nr:hypothetical protein [Planctomycetota bacterium]
MACLLVGACASNKREMRIKVNTSNARFYEGDRLLSTPAPSTVLLDVSRDHLIRVEADGYEPETLRLESGVSALRVVHVAAMSLLLPIIAGPFLWYRWTVDGYCYVLEPEEPEVILQRSTGTTWSSSPPPTWQPRRSESAPPRPAPSPPPPTAPRPTSAAPPSRPAYCGECGARVGARYCGECGRPAQ